MRSCNFSNYEKIFLYLFLNHRVRASLWLLQWWPLKYSIVSQINPVDIPILIAQKKSFNIIPLICDNIVTSELRTKYVGIVSHAPQSPFSKLNYDFLQPPVKVSMLLQNVFVSMVFLNSTLKLKLNITFKNILVNKHNFKTK